MWERKGEREEDFPQTIKDIGCWNFKEVKEFARDRVKRTWMNASSQS